MTSVPDRYGRHSVRGFRAAPVPRADLDAILAAAQRAPSWCNTQPWRVWLTEPPATGALAAALGAAARAALPHPDLPFPLDYPEPYLAHRRAGGGALYRAMGVARDDGAGRRNAWLRNYAFFDAPHCAVVACDRRLVPYALLDVGVWLGWLLTAAEERGVSTCPMAAVAAYPDVLRAHLGIPDELAILFGVAIGYEDAEVPANRCRTTRDPSAANVTFVLDFPPGAKSA